MQDILPRPLQLRCDHSAAAFNLCLGLIEVAIFGGNSDASKLSPIAKTTVLRFG